MKVTSKSRLLSATKPPAAPKLRGHRSNSKVGSFRAKLDWRWLCGCLAARGVAHRDVEDVAQEVLAAMAQAGPLPPLRPGQTAEQQRRALLSWWMRWRVWAYFQRKHMQVTTVCSDIEQLAVDTGDQEERLDREALCCVLGEALEVLRAKAPDAYVVVDAYELSDEPMARVAARLGILEGTAWSRLRRGRKELRAFFRRHAARQQRRLGGATGAPDDDDDDDDDDRGSLVAESGCRGKGGVPPTRPITPPDSRSLERMSLRA